MKFTIYDGPNKVKKRWAIGIAAIAGIAQTIEHIPEWAKQALNFIAGLI